MPSSAGRDAKMLRNNSIDSQSRKRRIGSRLQPAPFRGMSQAREFGSSRESDASQKAGGSHVGRAGRRASFRDVSIAAFLLGAASFARGEDAQPAPTRPGLSYAGVYAQSNSAVLDAANAEAGVTVTRVIENSPAEAAGIRVGDVIVQVNERDITDANQLLAAIEGLPVGSRAAFVVERDAERLELSANTVERVAAPPDPHAEGAPPATFSERKRLGFRFTPPDAALSERLGIAPRQGVQVTAVTPEGPMDRAGVKAGDVVITAVGEAVFSPQAFLQAVEKTASGGAKTIELGVVGGGGLVKDRTVKFFKPARETKKLSIPLIYSYQRGPTSSDTKVLGGLFGRERLENATKYRLFWLFKFETGNSAELLEPGS